jgi:phospholipid/cholesterol/gamma-HCH transport system substrate-binding protein
MDKKSTDFAVGLFVIAGLLALLFLSLKAGNLATIELSSHTYLVRAKFDNIGGLKARAAVRSAGVVVGRVERIDFDNQTYQAVATLAVTDKFHFPKDTAAKILTSGLLGEQYVGLDPGGDPEMLASGDQIQNTQSAVVLENLIGQFLFNKAADASGNDAQKGTGAATPGPNPAGGASGPADLSLPSVAPASPAKPPPGKGAKS